MPILGASGKVQVNRNNASAGENASVGSSGESAEIHIRGALFIVAVIALMVAVWAYINGGGQKTQNRFEVLDPLFESYQGLNALVNIPGDLVGDQSTGHEWRQPDWDCKKNVLTPHRYPSVSGGNISTVIHEGWSSLMRPAPQDADWQDMPPSGVEW
jgi:hypothetical protein